MLDKYTQIKKDIYFSLAISSFAILEKYLENELLNYLYFSKVWCLSTNIIEIVFHVHNILFIFT